MNRTFLPLVRASKGRIINLSSVGSQLKPYSDVIQSRFRSVKSLEEVQALADEYVVRPFPHDNPQSISHSSSGIVKCGSQDRDRIRLGRARAGV